MARLGSFVAFVTIMLMSLLAPLTTAFALRGDVRWRPLARVSLAVGVLIPCLAVLVPSQPGF